MAHLRETAAQERRRHRGGPVLHLTPAQEAQRIAIARLADAVIEETDRRHRLRRALHRHLRGPLRIIPSVVIGAAAVTAGLFAIAAVIWAYT